MSRSILLVDDSELVRRALRNWLESLFPEFRIEEARNGEEGVVLAHSHRPMVVLMDLKMGGVNGIEAARFIRASLPGTAVVVLTAYDAPAYRSVAETAGAAGYVLKSRAHVELIPLLRDLLSGQDRAPTGTRTAV